MRACTRLCAAELFKMSLKELLIFSVVIFSALSAFLVLLHEYHLVNHDKNDVVVSSGTSGEIGTYLLTYLLTHLLTHLLAYSLTHSLIHSFTHTHSLTHSPTYLLTYLLTYSLTHSLIHSLHNALGNKKSRESSKRIKPHKHDKEGNYKLQALLRSRENVTAGKVTNNRHDAHETAIKTLYEIEKHESSPDKESLEEAATSNPHVVKHVESSQGLLSKAEIRKQEKKGSLTCNNVAVDSEIIYWKQVFYSLILVYLPTHSLTHLCNRFPVMESLSHQ